MQNGPPPLIPISEEHVPYCGNGYANRRAPKSTFPCNQTINWNPTKDHFTGKERLLNHHFNRQPFYEAARDAQISSHYQQDKSQRQSNPSYLYPESQQNNHAAKKTAIYQNNNRTVPTPSAKMPKLQPITECQPFYRPISPPPASERLQFLVDNPILLQELIVNEKLRSSDDRSITVLSHPDQLSIQVIALERLFHIYHIGEIHLRLLDDSDPAIVLVIPTPDLSRFSGYTTDIGTFRNWAGLPPAVVELLNSPLAADYSSRYALLLYDVGLRCWELAGCLSPLDSFITPVQSSKISEFENNSSCAEYRREIGVKNCMNRVNGLSAEPLEKASLNLPAFPCDSERSARSQEFHSVPRLYLEDNAVIKEVPAMWVNSLLRSIAKQAMADHKIVNQPSKTGCNTCDKIYPHKVINKLPLNTPALPEKSQLSRSFLNKPKATHEPLTYPSKCITCDMEFPDRRTTVEHMKSAFHQAASQKCPLYRCLLCNYMTCHSRGLSRHVTVQHCQKREVPLVESVGNEQQSKVCQLCRKTFLLQLSFDLHWTIVHGDSIDMSSTMFHCEFCDHISIRCDWILAHVRSIHIELLTKPQLDELCVSIASQADVIR